MSTKVKQIVKTRSVRFCLGCLFAAAAFAISVLAYDKAKAGLFFAVLFLLAGAVKIPDTLIPKRGLTVLYAARNAAAGRVASLPREDIMVG